MNNIRLRAWNERRRRMVYDLTVEFSRDYDGIRLVTPDHNDIVGDLMLWTGYRDITMWEELSEAEREQWARYSMPSEWNGRDMWQGDIVRYKLKSGYDDSYEEYTEEIRFRGGTFYPIPDVYDCEDSYYSFRYYDFRVIGNRHEDNHFLSNKGV